MQSLSAQDVDTVISAVVFIEDTLHEIRQLILQIDNANPNDALGTAMVRLRPHLRSLWSIVGRRRTRRAIAAFHAAVHTHRPESITLDGHYYPTLILGILTQASQVFLWGGHQIRRASSLRWTREFERLLARPSTVKDYATSYLLNWPVSRWTSTEKILADFHYEIRVAKEATPESGGVARPLPRSVPLSDASGTAVAKVTTHGGANTPTTESNWSKHRTGGLPLRGWAEIMSFIEAKNTRSSRTKIRLMNDTTGGPIVTVRRCPEVDGGELKAWIEDLRGRAAAAVRSRQSQGSTDVAISQPEHQAELGMQEQKRPNARGKAK